jgi:hypothetical protein
VMEPLLNVPAADFEFAMKIRVRVVDMGTASGDGHACAALAHCSKVTACERTCTPPRTSTGVRCSPSTHALAHAREGAALTASRHAASC